MRYKKFESENSKLNISSVRLKPYFQQKKPKIQRNFEFEPSLISYQSQTENSFQQAARSQSKQQRNRSFVKEKVNQTEQKKIQESHHHSHSVDIGFQVNLKNLLEKKKQSILISQKQDDSIDLSLSKINESRMNFAYKKQSNNKQEAEIRQLEQEILKEKEQIEDEMKQIYMQMQIVQKKHENAFPKIAEQDYRFQDLKNQQEQKLQQLQKFYDYLKQLRILKEKNLMSQQELIDIHQQIIDCQSQKQTLEDEVKNLDQMFHQLENENQLLDNKIVNKQKLEQLQQQETDIQNQLKQINDNLIKQQQDYFEINKQVNDVMQQKTQDFENCLIQKNEIIQLTNLNYVQKNFVLDKAQEMSKYVQENYCNKISQLNIDMNVENLKEIQNEIKVDLEKITQLDLVKKDTIECIKTIEDIFVKFINQTTNNFIDLTNELQNKKKTKNNFKEITQKQNDLNEQLQDVQQQIKQEQKKNNTENIHESIASIDFNYLSESLTEDYFQTLRSSLNQLEIKKKVGDKKLQQQIEDFEIKICKIDYYQEKIEKLNNRKKSLNEQVVKSQNVLKECLQIKTPFIQEIMNVIYSEQEDLHNFVVNLPSLYQRFNLQEKVNNIITNHYELNEDIMNFLEGYANSTEDLFNQDLSFLQILDTKQKLLELNKIDQDIYKKQWQDLKKQIEIINVEKMPKLEEKKEQLKRMKDNLHNKSLSNSNILVEQNKRQPQIKIKKELVKNIIINLQNHFEFNQDFIVQHLSNGFEIYLKSNFNKEFNLLKYIELIQIKKIRTSLQKFGFVKKFLKFDFVFNQVNIYDIKSQKVEKISFQDFYQFQISSFTDRMIKSKMPQSYPVSTLNIYSLHLF